MAISETTRQQKLAESKARRERMAQVQEAVTDEQVRFNEALENGAKVLLGTHSGEYYVRQVNADWWYSCNAVYGGDSMFDSSFCGCNDGTWAELLEQAGVARHPLFAENKQQ